jgi:hypothetical protein
VLVVRWWFAGGSIMRLIACIVCLTIPAQFIVVVVRWRGVLVVVRCAIAYNARVIILIRLIVIVCRGGAWWRGVLVVVRGGGVLYYRQKKAPIKGRILS